MVDNQMAIVFEGVPFSEASGAIYLEPIENNLAFSFYFWERVELILLTVKRNIQTPPDLFPHF